MLYNAKQAVKRYNLYLITLKKYLKKWHRINGFKKGNKHDKFR